MKRGFSLVELLVVIGIIGILAGVMFTSFSGGGESAKAAQCLANMRNLASACQAYGAVSQFYPLAGSIEYMTVNESRGASRAQMEYHEKAGWISWNSAGAYRGKPASHVASASWMTSLYSDDDEANSYCLTNGVLWKYVAGNRKTYVCPSHALKMTKAKQKPPVWSYLMNAYFGWDDSQGKTALSNRDYNSYPYGRLGRAERILLFGEVPYDGSIGSWQPEGAGSGTDCDCVLQFDTSVKTSGDKGKNGNASAAENIGFNHKSGKQTFANVVFADGHTEKLRLPNEVNDGMLRELTAWLCTGTDVTFDGKQYRKAMPD